jgi:hypothetical protein
LAGEEPTLGIDDARHYDNTELRPIAHNVQAVFMLSWQLNKTVLKGGEGRDSLRRGPGGRRKLWRQTPPIEWIRFLNY